jgi:hypothetical protein
VTSALCHSFQRIADRVWRDIADADDAGLAFSEETITETILLELHRDHRERIRVKAFSKAEEKRNGSDWEWWIGRPGRWLGMRVQAKRISLPEEAFNRLQTYGATKRGGTRQIDALIAAAAHDRLNAVYCFYVHSRKWPTMRAWPVYNALGGGPISPQGCFVAEAGAVRSTKANALSKVAPVCLPWHLLVCHCSNGAFNGPSLADATYAALRASIELGGAISSASELPETTSLVPPVETLPSYMRFLTDDGDGVGEDQLREAALVRGLRGFVLITE